MRDYIQLANDLERQASADSLGDFSRQLMTQAAQAVRELKVIADKMTSLGSDLEDQVSEQLQADEFFHGDFSFDNLESVMRDAAPLEIRQVERTHSLPDIWAVKTSSGILEFYSLADAEMAVEEDEGK